MFDAIISFVAVPAKEESPMTAIATNSNNETSKAEPCCVDRFLLSFSLLFSISISAAFISDDDGRLVNLITVLVVAHGMLIIQDSVFSGVCLILDF